MENMILYYFEACPYCQKVLRFLKEHHIQIPSKDIRVEEQARDALVKIGGKSQVPCLVLNGEALYESDAIVAWLQENVAAK